MARGRRPVGLFKYDNIEKRDKNFMYLNLKSSNCYNCNFSGSNFDFVSFRGAHFKKCSFQQCTFNGAEFIGSNLKESKFKGAQFENTIFEGVNLDGVNFQEAEFKNTIFVGTDVEKAKNLDHGDPGIRIFDEMPELEISDNLKKAVEDIMENQFVKKSRVFDTKEGNISPITIMLLLENFHEESLIKRLEIIKDQIDRDFHTLSYVIRFLEKAQ
ncbi:pentapeptide repeat-containing protein [Clostridium paraputrificum]|uniref:pentapeptide repeat-containing protein n=1 Tax=Clostridium TaxID=1485 RepID=UPI003D34A0AA